MTGSRRKDPHRLMRVCMVHFSSFELDSRVQRQARSLARLGHEVHCICLDGPGRFLEGDGVIRTYPVGGMSGKPRAGTLNYVRGYASFFARAATRVAALQRLHPLDLVEVHNMPNFLTYAGLSAKLRGVPVMLDVHDTFPELFATRYGFGADHPLVRAMRAEERLGAAIADRMLVVTKEAGEVLGARGVGVGKTHVVMNSPDERVFGPRRSPEELPVDSPRRIVYHGGVAERFGVETLVRATGHLNGDLNGGRVDIFGACAVDAQRIRGLASQLAPDKVWVADKPTPFPQMPERLAGAHVGVVPTLRDEFTELLLPVKLLEYVHLGIPVVTSRLPVIERYFSSDEVNFFDPGSERSLADAIRRVCARPDVALERANRASRRLGSFEWARQRQTYLGVVGELTGTELAAA